MPLISDVERKSKRGRTMILIIGVILWTGVMLHLFPVYWTLISSFKTDSEIYRLPPTLWPQQPVWDVYAKLLGGLVTSLMTMPLMKYVKNSLILVGGVMILQIPLSAMIGYGLSKLHGQRWSKLLFLFFVGSMMIPNEISLIPSYLILQNFPFPSRTAIPYIPFTQIQLPHVNLLNTFWAIILPSMAWAWAVLLFKGYFDTLPNDVLDSARVDGASEFRIFLRIMCPMAGPVFGVIAYQTFTSVWNSFFWPLIVLKDPHKWPLAVALYDVQNKISQINNPNSPTLQRDYKGLGWNAVMALGVIESIPTFLAFIIFREQIMRGFRVSSFL